MTDALSLRDLQAQLKLRKSAAPREFEALKKLEGRFWNPFLAEWYANQFLSARDFLSENWRVELKSLDGTCAEFAGESLSFFCSAVYPAVVWEIFCAKTYQFSEKVGADKKFAVVDIGANRGYSALYFAQFDWCEKVFAFELFGQNAEFAKKSAALNAPKIREKIKFFDFGLGAKNGEVDAVFYKNADGESTFAPELSKKNGKGAKVEKCQVRSAAETLSGLVESEKCGELILKVDVEGAEYEIFEDLAQNFPQIFEKTAKIVGETHLGFSRFLRIFDGKNGVFWRVVRKGENEDAACVFELSKIAPQKK